jgi:hypothetical protein
VLERLIALTADAEMVVRRAVVEVLGAVAATHTVLGCLAQFWQAHLADSEWQFIGAEYGRVGDIAYRQLQQIAVRRGARIDEH